MELHQDKEDLKLNAEILERIGFSTKGVRKGLFDRKGFTLMSTVAGYFIVDDY